MDSVQVGLRCQDIQISSSESIDPNDAALGQIEETHLIGMAASLATAIRGQDVIADAQSLKRIAMDQLEINQYAFPKLIELLSEAGWIRNISSNGDRLLSFDESIPIHQDLYSTLGEIWDDRKPDEFERTIVATTQRLATGIISKEDFAAQVGFDKTDEAEVLDFTLRLQMAKEIKTADGIVLYSPFFFFENAEEMEPLLARHSPGELQETISEIRSRQGLAVSSTSSAALQDAVSLGLLMAPTVQAPGGNEIAFAFLPYSPDKSLLRVRKAVLSKALAIVACVRCGEDFGGATDISRPKAILSALLDDSRDNMLRPHSSHQRQYQLLFREQIVDFVPSGNWVKPKLIKTADNIAAMKFALELITSGEAVTDRIPVPDDFRAMLSNPGRYAPAIKTVHKRRNAKRALTDVQYSDLFHAVMGFRAL